MSLLPTNPRQATPSFDAPAALTPKQANIYLGLAAECSLQGCCVWPSIRQDLPRQSRDAPSRAPGGEVGRQRRRRVWYATPTQK